MKWTSPTAICHLVALLTSFRTEEWPRSVSASNLRGEPSDLELLELRQIRAGFI